ncbi:hypothetical protein ACHAXS_010578 [Conticribra weissflogii]
MSETAILHSANREEENSRENAPFEWLTNFRSLRHFMSPSRIIFDDHSADVKIPEDAQTGATDIDAGSAWIDEENGRNVILLNALHVGCGTSTVGEWLWDLRETRKIDATNENSLRECGGREVQLRYGHVLNVDVDKEALCVMKRRWNRLRPRHCNDVHGNRASQIDTTNSKLSSDMIPTVVGMEWKYLDFGDESSCRLALDPIYSRLHLRRENHQDNSNELTEDLSTKNLTEVCVKSTHLNAIIETEDGATTAIPTAARNTRISSSGDGGGYFDLVLDKSTLDCLLCAETEVVAGLLCEVYRALRVPGAQSDAIDRIWDWGGIYVLITFHPKEFIETLLVNLPEAEWDVMHEVVTREVEDIVSGNVSSNCNEAGIESKHSAKSQHFIKSNSRGTGIQHHLDKTAYSPSSAWSTGTFQPDENYRRTVNVFTCRRRQRCKHQNQSSLSFALDREKVRKHIERTCDEWYRKTNPMVTVQREEEIRSAFSREISSMAANDLERSQGASHDNTLDLNACYKILFTAAEKEHLTFEFFTEDWDAYCSERHFQDKNESDVGNIPIGHTGEKGCEHDSVGVLRNRMTVEVALDFLREMQ